MSYCLGKLERIEKALVVYGHSLGESDRHIADVIGDNRELEHVYLGCHGKVTGRLKATVSYLEARRSKLRAKDNKAKELKIFIFDSTTAPVWDPNPN